MSGPGTTKQSCSRAACARAAGDQQESEAAEEAGRAIALDAYNVEALYILACVKASERKGNESRSLARRAVSLDPFNFGARRVLSQYLDGQAGYEQRVADQARIRYASGRSLKQEGQLTRAVTELEAALASSRITTAR